MRLKLVVAYNGGPYRGWQKQAAGDTVQERLENAFAKVCGAPVAVHGSGRTDAGVHALGQCAHADVANGALTTGKWQTALNAHLPPEIRVMKCSRAPQTFHARFSAKGKIYTYRIWNDAVQPPFEAGRSWHLPGTLDLAVLRAEAQKLTGMHDFAAFAASRGKGGAPVRSTLRTLRQIKVCKRGPLLTLTFEGDGFLYKMARLITGSLVRCAQHRAEPDWISTLLARKTKTSFAAPAGGLCLTRVIY